VNELHKEVWWTMTDAEWANIINGIMAIGTAVTAVFTWRTAAQTKRSVQNQDRPILIMTPGSADLEFISKPNITVKNFGRGPAVVDEVQFWGMEMVSDGGTGLQHAPMKTPLSIKPKAIIAPGEESVFEKYNNTGLLYGEKPGVKFVLRYLDYAGNKYEQICEWNDSDKRWDRTEK
jgi:hypothetical protein